MASTASKLKIGNVTRSIVAVADGWAGATAGWTKTASQNYPTVVCAASATNATWVCGLKDLCVGDQIVGIKITGGKTGTTAGTLTLDCDIRSITNNANGTYTDALVATITTTTLTDNLAQALNIYYVLTTAQQLLARVTTGLQYYLVFKATTLATTTITLQCVELETRKSFGLVA